MQDLTRDEWSWTASQEHDASEFQALIINYSTKAVLLSQQEDWWVMPAHASHKYKYESSYLPEFVKGKLREELGQSMNLNVLRPVWREEMRVRKDRTTSTLEKAVVLLECVDGSLQSMPMGKTGIQYDWVPLVEAKVYHLFASARKLISNEIDYVIHDTVPENRLSWQRPGWYQRTSLWMKEELFRVRKTHMFEPILFERLTPRCAVVYADSSAGRFFLKCTLPLANDAAYTEVLARAVPRYVAAPVAVNAEEQVMITSDYGKIFSGLQLDNDEKLKLCRNFLDIQRHAVERVEELVSAGMPDFREKALRKRMDWLANHAMLDTIAKQQEYSEAVQFYRKNLGALKTKVSELYASGIPPTVTHNDMALSNLYLSKNGENYMLFDWMEGYVAHPFASHTDGIPIDAYLEGWTDYGSLERLKEWDDMGWRVRNVIQAILELTEAEFLEEPGRQEPLHIGCEALNEIHACFRDKV